MTQGSQNSNKSKRDKQIQAMNDRLGDLLGGGPSVAETLEESLPAVARAATTKRKAKPIWKMPRSLKKGKTKKDRVQVIHNDPAGRAKLMEVFYGQVENLETKISSLTKASKRIREMTQSILSQVQSSEDEKEVDAKFLKLVNKANQNAKGIKDQLSRMKEETATLATKTSILDHSDLR